jgi:PAS domain S-box-containing protein
MKNSPQGGADQSKEIYLDPRIEKITDLFVSYSLGNFEDKLEPEGKYDEVDAFMTIMNMMGEELKSSTISRNYFNNIFHSVTDLVFVLDTRGLLLSVNRAVSDKLGFGSILLGQPFLDSKFIRERDVFSELLSDLTSDNSTVDKEGDLYQATQEPLPVRCTSSYLLSHTQHRIGYLIIAKDLTRIRKYEKSLEESEEKYKRIFQESSDTIFVATTSGFFQDLNNAGQSLLKCNPLSFEGLNLFELFGDEVKTGVFRQEMMERGLVVNLQITLKDTQGGMVACLISANKIQNECGLITGFHGIIKNISQQKAMENLVIRTIVDTQEKERKRFAMDLHDGLGQQLSAIKFYLSTLKSIQGKLRKKPIDLLFKSTEALDQVLAELRNVCFNLMPGTLQSFGLRHALLELCKKIEFDHPIEFDMHIADEIPRLDKSLEIAIFRIMQEFINNSIRHGLAKKVRIIMRNNIVENSLANLNIVLEDNGTGFQVKHLSEYEGMGLKNVKSRVESYNGQVRIVSIPGHGTRYDLVIPYLNNPSRV